MGVVFYKDLTNPGEIVAQRRSEVGLTQTEVCKKMGYANPNFISMMERGTSRVPVERSLEFAELLEMDKAWFIEKVLRNHYPDFSAFLFNKQTLSSLIDGREDEPLQRIIVGSGKK